MNFSPEDKQKVIRMAAELMVEEIKKEAGGSLAALVLIPVPTVARLFGMAGPSIGRKFRVTTISHRSQGVSLDQLLDFAAGKPLPEVQEKPSTLRKAS